MSIRVAKLFHGAAKNREFLNEIAEADGDKFPRIPLLASGTTKSIWAGFYFGWLVAKHGNQWEENI